MNTPFFNFINYAAINDAKKDEKGRLIYRRLQSGSIFMPVLMVLTATAFILISIYQSGVFSFGDAFMLAAPLFFGGFLIYNHLKNDIKVIFSDEGISIMGGLRKKKTLLWQEITEVSSFAPFDFTTYTPNSQIVPVMSMLIYFKDSKQTVFALPVLMNGFADFFNMANQKLSNKPFDQEFQKVIAYYKRSKIDIVNKKVITTDPFQSDTPFEGF